MFLCILDVTVSVRVTRSLMCNLIHPLYCACLHQGKRPDIAASKMVRLYQQAVDSLVSSGRYFINLIININLLLNNYLFFI